MSVIITNVAHIGNADECEYIVRINLDKPLARCTHNRSDGLAVLLRKMADALDAMEDGD